MRKKLDYRLPNFQISSVVIHLVIDEGAWDFFTECLCFQVGFKNGLKIRLGVDAFIMNVLIIFVLPFEFI